MDRSRIPAHRRRSCARCLRQTRPNPTILTWAGGSICNELNLVGVVLASPSESRFGRRFGRKAPCARFGVDAAGWESGPFRCWLLSLSSTYGGARVCAWNLGQEVGAVQPQHSASRSVIASVVRRLLIAEHLSLAGSPTRFYKSPSAGATVSVRTWPRRSRVSRLG